MFRAMGRMVFLGIRKEVKLWLSLYVTMIIPAEVGPSISSYAIETSVTCPVGIQVRVSPLRTPWLSWKATEMGRFFDCKNRGPSSQQACHDENPSMIKGRERRDSLLKIRSFTFSNFVMSRQRRNKTRERKRFNYNYNIILIRLTPRAKATFCRSLPAMVTSPYNWNAFQWDVKQNSVNQSTGLSYW